MSKHGLEDAFRHRREANLQMYEIFNPSDVSLFTSYAHSFHFDPKQKAYIL